MAESKARWQEGSRERISERPPVPILVIALLVAGLALLAKLLL